MVNTRIHIFHRHPKSAIIFYFSSSNACPCNHKFSSKNRYKTVRLVCACCSDFYFRISFSFVLTMNFNCLFRFNLFNLFSYGRHCEQSIQFLLQTNKEHERRIVSIRFDSYKHFLPKYSKYRCVSNKLSIITDN